MVATNTKAHTEYAQTYEGGRAAPETGPFSISPQEQLLRRVATCLLHEPTFYESGEEIAEGIRNAARACSLSEVTRVAVTARNDLRLRHVPLFLAVLLARRGYAAQDAPRSLVADIVANVVQRPDEMGELISMYWREAKIERTQGDPKKTGARIPWQVRRGLQRALARFDSYQLSKWAEQDKAVKLKDVLFLTHPRPASPEQAALWKSVIDGTLAAPDTWEVIISGASANGLTKKEAWERVIDTWITDEDG